MKTEVIYETLVQQASELDKKSRASVNASIEYLGAKQASRQLGDRISVHFSEVVASVESSPDVCDPDTRALVVKFVKDLATRMGKLCAEAFQNASEGALREEGKAYMAASTADQMRRQAEAHKAAAALREASADAPAPEPEPEPVIEEPAPAPEAPRKLRKLRR